MGIRNGPALQIQEIGVGCILWLPPFNDSNGDLLPLCQRHTGIEKHLLSINGFDHPVVVLDIYNPGDSNSSIQFLIDSSNYRYSAPLRYGSPTQFGAKYSLESQKWIAASTITSSTATHSTTTNRESTSWE
ncbi:hypothetical protein BPOR_0457g00030 [Botrytis porri]|uniref:Uncharacterized protein n=1 Tax=Botrytis porri TaxID=87229 RepID=A0A4Z1KH47_9HELO|nr:hypothetical protein BPOR_0457g00030 [Botrytis porri]